MTVLARSKSGAGRIRRHREARLGRATVQGGDAAKAAAQPSPPARGATAARRRREAGAPEDSAVYT
ncbi:MAG: hypothetical protein ACRDNS_27730, partial [Trebonia sp.]